MNSFHSGCAATAPVILRPIGALTSLPTQTPTVIRGVKPTNQASV